MGCLQSRGKGLKARFYFSNLGQWVWPTADWKLTGILCPPSRVAKKMGLNYVSYDLSRWKGKMRSTLLEQRGVNSQNIEPIS